VGGVEGGEELVVHDHNRRIVAHDAIQVLLLTQVDKALRAGLFGLVALRRGRGEITLKKRENIGVSLFDRLGSEHNAPMQL
jgi:hypothetical protein